MCHGMVGIGTIFRVACARYWPSFGISWTLKWYCIQLLLINFHSLKTMLFYCFIVCQGSLIVNMQSSPYWSNSKQLGPGRMGLPHWKLLFHIGRDPFFTCDIKRDICPKSTIVLPINIRSECNLFLVTCIKYKEHLFSLAEQELFVYILLV